MPSKQNFSTLCSTFIFILLLLAGCGRTGADHWSEFIPESALFVVVPEENTSIGEMLSAPYMPMFDDISPAAIQLVSNIQEQSPTGLQVEAMLLYPDTSNDWQPVWITEKSDGLVEGLTSLFQREFEQNRYEFLGHTIEKLFFSDRIIFILEIGNWTVFSESSLAIENMLRTLRGNSGSIELEPGQTAPGSVIFNTPSLDIWAKQIAQVTYRPFLDGILEGSAPVDFTFHRPENEAWEWQMRGEMPLGSGRSTLLRYISSEPRPFLLDRYVPINAAAFSIFRAQPIQSFDDTDPVHDLDQHLMSNRDVLQTLRQSIADEVAFVSFAESGPASASEYVYLRTIQNPDLIRMVLDNLDSQDLAIKDENTYFLNSTILGTLFGSDLYPGEDFYITIYDRVAAMAQRKGLAESVGGDAERRRVMYYDDDYSKVIQSHTEPLSSIFYMDATRFGRFIQPWLYPQHYMSTLLGTMDEFVISSRRAEDGSSLELKLTNFERERTERPFREQWVFPLGQDVEITGTPVIADVTGSARNELIFSTSYGSVYVLASDGTTVIQVNTQDDDVPIGSPVIFDWYGNNQNVIMQSAGDKVYAWNQNGVLLPNFPVHLNEEITTPLKVMDVTGNGMAEMILATADRQVYILNARGQAISGWPQSTNSVVQSTPLVAEINEVSSLFVFAENTLHGWNINGQRRNDYPVFLSAQMHGSPALFDQHILGAGLDGNLYSVGTQPLFTDTQSTSHRSNSLHIQSIPVSNSRLNATPQVESVLLRDEDEFNRDDLILLQSANGSIFLYNRLGELKFTQSLGQPASGDIGPIITDINNDQREDVIALADFGRFYAWDILSTERHRELPTSGMRYPLVQDFFGDGNKEIIAQTRDGLQCWTIYFTEREAQESD